MSLNSMSLYLALLLEVEEGVTALLLLCKILVRRRMYHVARPLLIIKFNTIHSQHQPVASIRAQ